MLLVSVQAGVAIAMNTPFCRDPPACSVIEPDALSDGETSVPTEKAIAPITATQQTLVIELIPEQ